MFSSQSSRSGTPETGAAAASQLGPNSSRGALNPPVDSSRGPALNTLYLMRDFGASKHRHSLTRSTITSGGRFAPRPGKSMTGVWRRHTSTFTDSLTTRLRSVG